jgi:probable F420-dependent oxidoreductase
MSDDQRDISPVDRGNVGICLRPQYAGAYSIDAMRAQARRADENGFHSVWLAESWGQSAVPVLADLAARTSRVVVGTAIVNVFSRTPSLLAMTASTMTELFPDRFVLGLGAGTRALVEDWHGLSFERPIDRMRDAIAVVKAATAGEKVDYRGATVAVSGYRLRVPVGQRPAAVYVAALGTRGLDLVAEAADGWLPYLLARRRLPEQIARIEERAAAVGRADRPAVAPLIVTCVDEDAAVARGQARRHIAGYLGAMGPHYRDFVSRHGYPQEVVAVAEAWAAGERDRAVAAVSDEMLDDIAICGSPDECAGQIERWRAAGAELPILHFPSATTTHGVDLAIETLGGVHPAEVSAR